ncbi:hypothetical protein AB1Y20_010764 [Prymnesium parvum]|uniref:CS domain-containing protein n=1 Tax=Prymnesium parvum TaxID=97485 RepID=A0AB34ISR9_PRYPA
MCSWVLRHGGQCALSQSDPPDAPPRLRTSAAARRGTLLLSAPAALTLTSHAAASGELAYVVARHPELDAPPFILALALLLLDHRAALSPPHPLLAALPTEAQLRAMPLLMRPAELRRLRGTDAHALAAELSEELLGSYEQHVAPLAAAAGSPFGGAVPPLARWRWSLAVTWRCALPFGSQLVLAPLLCGAAHAARAPRLRVEWNEARRELRVSAARSLRANASVTVDFGRRSSAELLVARGEQRAAESVRFHLRGGGEEDAWRATRAALLAARGGGGLGEPMHLYAGRLEERTLEGVAIHVATPAQLEALARLPEGAAWRLDAVEGLEEAVLVNLAHVCHTRLWAALRLRVEEQTILESTLQLVEWRQLQAGTPPPAASAWRRAQPPAAPTPAATTTTTASTSAATPPPPACPPNAVCADAPTAALFRSWSAPQLCAWACRLSEAAPPAASCASWTLTPPQLLHAAERGARATCAALSSAGLPQGAAPCARAVWPSVRRLWADGVAAAAPPLRWAQNETSVQVAVHLRALSLLAPPELRGASLRFACRGAARGEPPRNYSVALELFRAPLPLDEARVQLSATQLRVVMSKGAETRREHSCGREGEALLSAEEEEAAHVGNVECGEGEEDLRLPWPRLVLHRSVDKALRRLGKLLPDWEELGRSAQRADEEEAETERVRQNIFWLEDKWARQGRGKLEDVISASPALTSEQLEAMRRMAQSAERQQQQPAQSPQTDASSPSLLEKNEL